MHHNAKPPNWKLMPKKIAKEFRMTRWTNGHIILPLRVFDPVAYGHICCAQLQSAQFITKNKWG